MFNGIYLEHNHKKIKTIIDTLGHQFFHGKKVLDLGAGYCDIGGAIWRLGADVTAVDARSEHLIIAQKKYPGIKTQTVDLDSEWPFQSFDVILDLDLLCHLKNFETHLRNVCHSTNHVILETAVCDSSDPNLSMLLPENKEVYDLSYHGFSSRPTATMIERIFTECGFEFKRIDYSNLNCGKNTYDWRVTNSQACENHKRRFWIAKRSKKAAAPKPMRKMVVNGSIMPGNRLALPAMTNTAQFTQNVSNVNSATQAPNMSVAPPSILVSPANKLPKIRLFYNYYQDKNPERQKEIDVCFNKNINNPLFDIIVLASDTTPTYNFFFDKINKLSGPNDINIICNSDIFFDDTIALTANMGTKDFYALSRWDWSDGHSALRDLKNSQDTWIIRGKVENVNGDIPLGVPFCDNRIAYEFNKAGYRVSNPSKSIKTYHYHNSNIRRYADNERVPGPILFVTPTEMPDVHIFACTSMSPKPEAFALQKECIASWINAGCDVVAFQSAEELKIFKPEEWPGVKFIATEPSKIFSSYIPVSSITKWIASQQSLSLIINADCRLCVSAPVMQYFAEQAKKGMVYFVRHDLDTNDKGIKQISGGIDGFLLPPQNAALIPESDVFCIGKPWWDTLMPIIMFRNNKYLTSPSFPVILHKIHERQWSLDNDFNLCQAEFIRLLGWNKEDQNDKIMYRCDSGGEMQRRIETLTNHVSYDPSWPPLLWSEK